MAIAGATFGSAAVHRMIGDTGSFYSLRRSRKARPTIPVATSLAISWVTSSKRMLLASSLTFPAYTG